MFWKLFSRKSDSDKELELLRTQSGLEIKKLESTNTAKEVASKYIGKTAIPWIVLLVVVGVGASAIMPSESLPAVIGLVSTAVMALITMLSNITSSKEKEEKPEIKIIETLIRNLDEPMTVNIDGEKVTVSKGSNSMTTNRAASENKK